MEEKQDRRGGAREISEDGKKRRTNAAKAYWQQRREEKERQETLMREIKRQAEKRQRMREMCKDYDPQPILGMTRMETVKLARRRSAEASRTMRIWEADTGKRRMVKDEMEQYAGCIYASISYFNNRDERHRKALLYREECRREQEEKRLKRDIGTGRHRADVVIHIL